MTPDLPRFRDLSAQGNFIPVYRELVADLETPVSAWYRVCKGRPYSFLLESVEGGETIGRYSFLGCDPLWVLEVRGDRSVRRDRSGTETTFTGDPFVALAESLAPLKPVHLPELPASIAGMVGYWGYELMRWIEPKVPVFDGDENDLPDGLFFQIDSILVFDQVKRKIWAIAYADLREAEPEAAYEEACDRLQVLVDKLTAPLATDRLALDWQPPGSNPIAYTDSVQPEDFCKQV